MALPNPFRKSRPKETVIPLTPLRQAILQFLQEATASVPSDFVKGVLPPEILTKLCRDILAKMPEAQLINGVRAAAEFANRLVETIPPDLKLVTDESETKTNAVDS